MKEHGGRINAFNSEYKVASFESILRMLSIQNKVFSLWRTISMMPQSVKRYAFMWQLLVCNVSFLCLHDTREKGVVCNPTIEENTFLKF